MNGSKHIPEVFYKRCDKVITYDCKPNQVRLQPSPLHHVMLKGSAMNGHEMLQLEHVIGMKCCTLHPHSGTIPNYQA